MNHILGSLLVIQMRRHENTYTVRNTYTLHFRFLVCQLSSVALPINLFCFGDFELVFVGVSTFIGVLGGLCNLFFAFLTFNKLDDFNSLLNHTEDDFTPSGNQCYTNDNGGKLHHILMQELYNLRWYIQHLIDENAYQYDDDEWTNPLSKSNWIFLTNKKFMKYVVFT